MPGRTVTALRSAGRGRVRVELDGEPWRILPLEVVVGTGLATGTELDRPRARAIGRELRRVQALDAAARALRHRELPLRELDGRLARLGVRAGERASALGTLERTGLVDDTRFARTRALLLADRGYGDAFIRHDLAARGLDPDTIGGAIDELDVEVDRAARLADARGRGGATFRYLARRGFAAESLEFLVADESRGELG